MRDEPTLFTQKTVQMSQPGGRVPWNASASGYQEVKWLVLERRLRNKTADTIATDLGEKWGWRVQLVIRWRHSAQGTRR